MTGVWVTLAGIVVVAALVAAWRAQQHRTAVHAAAAQEVLDGDRVIQLLEQQFRLPAREREDHGRD